MNAEPDDWTTCLAKAIAATLREIGPQLRGKPVVAFDIGCFPWHGSIELSVLTAEELNADPALWDPSEVAAWDHYNFAIELPSWHPAAELGRRMANAYYSAADGGRQATVEAFLRACAAAVASPEVTQSLAALLRDPRFRVSVSHPDDGRMFYPPDGIASV